MYKKFLIVASKQDRAGINITTQLSQFKENPVLSSIGNKPSFDFYLREEEIISDENLNHEKINQYDFVIFASKHQSEKNEKTLSIHAPGNIKEANYGGQNFQLCPTSALLQKQMFENLNQNVEKFNLKNYQISLEATHHGPLIEKPCLFIEIGSTENEWRDLKAAFVIAETISQTINSFKENPYNEVAIGIGGPHYCPNFNKIQEKSNLAISHIIPQYTFPLNEKIIQESIDKTEEEVDFFLVDWKGMGNAEMRNQVIEILKKFPQQIRRTSEIQK